MNRSQRIIKFFKTYTLEIVFILPLVVFVLSFTLVPICNTVLMSFKDQYSGETSISSYAYEFARPNFWKSVTNTLVFTAIALFIQIMMGFWIAMLLKQTFVGKGLARALVLLPLGVPTLVSGIAMTYIFRTSGYLNELVYRLGISEVPINWMGNYWPSMILTALADSWKVMPMVVLLFLAGLESVPTELYEAASLDGANFWQKLFYITLPQVKAMTTMTILMRVVDLLRAFELPSLLLGANFPFMGLLAYNEYKYGNRSYSAVVSTVLMLMIVIVVSLYMGIFERDKEAKR